MPPLTPGQQANLRVHILRWTDSAQPGWVECSFTDAASREWLFLEKAPIVTSAPLTPDSPYPTEGSLRCTILHPPTPSAPTVRVTTLSPWGVTSTDGTSEFDVLEDQLIDLRDD